MAKKAVKSCALQKHKKVEKEAVLGYILDRRMAIKKKQITVFMPSEGKFKLFNSLFQLKRGSKPNEAQSDAAPGSKYKGN